MVQTFATPNWFGQIGSIVDGLVTKEDESSTRVKAAGFGYANRRKALRCNLISESQLCYTWPEF